MNPLSNESELSKSNLKRETPNQVASWLTPINWQLYSTLKFPFSSSEQNATATFNAMVNTMESTLRTRVAFVRSTEIRSKSGETVPRHIHAALTSVKQIPYQLVTDIWCGMLGKSGAIGSDLALVEPYRYDCGGLEYLCKKIASDDSDWDIRNLQWFLPGRVLESNIHHSSSRLARRFQDQSNGIQSVRNAPSIGHIETDHVERGATDFRIGRNQREFGKTSSLSFPPRSVCVVSNRVQL